jgi:hypothetical protein
VVIIISCPCTIKNVIFIYKNKDISDLYELSYRGIVEGICWDMKIDENIHREHR